MATPPREIHAKPSFVDRFKAAKPLTWAVLIVLIGATLFEINLIWGILFLYWGIAPLRSGQVFLIEPIERDEAPLLFWMIMAMWFAFGLLYVVLDFVS